MGLTSLKNITGAMDRDQLLKRYQSGRGQGVREGWKPWLTVREVKSRGQSCVEVGSIVQRPYELLGRLEWKAFLAAERLRGVTDIREQYPLWPLESTEAIADAMGLRHPQVPKSPHKSLMTTDLVLTTDWPNEPVVPIYVKYAADLGERRTQEKLDIEAGWWAARGARLRVVTELELPDTLGNNLKQMHACRTVTPETLGTVELEDVEAAFLAALGKTPATPANVLSHGVDKALGLDAGVCLTVFWHMASTRRLRIDLMAPFVPTDPFRLLGAGET